MVGAAPTASGETMPIPVTQIRIERCDAAQMLYSGQIEVSIGGGCANLSACSMPSSHPQSPSTNRFLRMHRDRPSARC